MQRPFGNAKQAPARRLCVCKAEPTGPSRRSLAAAVLTAPLLNALPLPARAQDPAAGVLQNDLLAYRFTYPTRTASGRQIPLEFTRTPERYSSAAPLTADARQRMVAGLASLGDGITIGVFVGPASGALLTREQSEWSARLVAETVLADRSSARNTQGQRVPLASLESAQMEVRDGTPYYVYETVQQGSPNLFDPANATYRRGFCVTAARPAPDGKLYLYTLSLTCPSNGWSELEAEFKEAVNSFRLLPPGKEYVSPERDPWRFF